MARLARLTLPGYPHYVIQRGNNRQTIVTGAADCRMLLDVLDQNASKFQVAVHAYVLMSNHFHLLTTPQTQDGLTKMMQAVGRTYVRYFNRAQQRTGTLWEGRFRSTLIQPERYLLTCMASIDLNPVHAGLVAQPQDYPWSSHAHYIGIRADHWITPHALVWELGNTPFAREAAYAEMVRSGINPVQQVALTQATLSGWALGEKEFVVDLQKKTTRRVTRSNPGRPLSVSKTCIK